MKNRKGFTLVEVLLVVVIVAILAGIVIVAINPARQISQTNDTQRASDVKTILNAVMEYSLENRGAFPASIPDSVAGAAIIGDGAGQVDLCDDLVPTYIAGMPYDPTAAGATFTSCAAAYNTGYTIVEDANGRIVVAAPSAELTTISVNQ